MALITWNPLDKGTGVILTNNNFTSELKNKGVRATVGKSTGKWYWEYRIDSRVGNTTAQVSVGVSGLTESMETYNGVYGNGMVLNDTWGSSPVGTVYGFKLDMGALSLLIYKNHSFVATRSISIGSVFPVIYENNNQTMILTANFGASEFNIVTANPTAWNTLVSEGYQPYDLDNAYEPFTLTFKDIKPEVISVGLYHCTALRVNKGLVSWGNNASNVITNTPSDYDFKMVSVGFDHCTALRSDGSLVS
jgi:hypothetical protein